MFMFAFPELPQFIMAPPILDLFPSKTQFVMSACTISSDVYVYITIAPPLAPILGFEVV